MEETQLPKGFLTRMSGLMTPEEYEALLQSYTKPKYKGIRTNTLKCTPVEMTTRVPFDLEPVPWCPTGHYIEETIRPGKNPAYYAGLYYVQEPTAMTPAEALCPEPGDWVLDLCAAPGGKTTQLACKLSGEGLLVANEIVVGRAGILASNAERMGITNLMILNEFPERLVENFYEAFDKILVDAPCSGEGMFRKEPEALSGWSAERVEHCARRQEKILESMDKLLKPGGVLVYSTCTFAPEENECIVERLLATGNYQTEPLTMEGLSDRGRPDWTEKGTTEVMDTLRIMPYHVKGEGHYVARLRKVGQTSDDSGFGRRKAKGKLKKMGKRDLVDYEAFAKEYLVGQTFDHLYGFGEKLYSLPQGMTADQLAGLRVLRPGLHLGDFKKNRFEPSHTLAMALKPEAYAQVHEVASDDEAYAYLKGEPLVSKAVKGWTLVCWQGYPLGFGKASQGIIKNHYPKGLRIKKK